MSQLGRSRGQIPRAQREVSRVNPLGRPEGESLARAAKFAA